MPKYEDSTVKSANLEDIRYEMFYQRGVPLLRVIFPDGKSTQMDLPEAMAERLEAAADAAAQRLSKVKRP